MAFRTAVIVELSAPVTIWSVFIHTVVPRNRSKSLKSIINRRMGNWATASAKSSYCLVTLEYGMESRLANSVELSLMSKMALLLGAWW